MSKPNLGPLLLLGLITISVTRMGSVAIEPTAVVQASLTQHPTGQAAATPQLDSLPTPDLSGQAWVVQAVMGVMANCRPSLSVRTHLARMAMCTP